MIFFASLTEEKVSVTCRSPCCPKSWEPHAKVSVGASHSGPAPASPDLVSFEVLDLPVTWSELEHAGVAAVSGSWKSTGLVPPCSSHPAPAVPDLVASETSYLPFPESDLESNCCKHGLTSGTL